MAYALLENNRDLMFDGLGLGMENMHGYRINLLVGQGWTRASTPTAPSDCCKVTLTYLYEARLD